MDRSIAIILVLAGSGLTIDKIIEYIYFSLLQTALQLTYKIECNGTSLVLIIGLIPLWWNIFYYISSCLWATKGKRKKKKATPVTMSLGYPLSVFNKNSTLKKRKTQRVLQRHSTHLLPYNLDRTRRKFTLVCRSVSGGKEETLVIHDSITDLWVVPKTVAWIKHEHISASPRNSKPLRWNYYHLLVPNPHPRRRAQREYGFQNIGVPIFFHFSFFWKRILLFFGNAAPQLEVLPLFVFSNSQFFIRSAPFFLNSFPILWISKNSTK